MAAESHRLPSRSTEDASALLPKRAFAKVFSLSGAFTGKKSKFYISKSSSAAQRSIPETTCSRRRLRPCRPHASHRALHSLSPKRSRLISDRACSQDCSEISDGLDTGRSILKRRHGCLTFEDEGDSQDARKTSGQNWWLACALALDHFVSTEGTIWCLPSSGKKQAAAHNRCCGSLAILQQESETVCIPEVVNPTQAASCFGA